MGLYGNKVPRSILVHDLVTNAISETGLMTMGPLYPYGNPEKLIPFFALLSRWNHGIESQIP